MSRRARAGWLALLVAAAGCGKDTVAPVPPPEPVPLMVEEMFPAPRAVRVEDLPTIWARFSEPLDPYTVDERTVFLKVDALRIPVDVSWDAAGQRVVIVPRSPLSIGSTHTVRLTTAIHTASGRPLESEAWWQFRTVSVRVPTPASPAAGAADKGPWTGLLWRPTEPTTGALSYAVHAGPDSVAVATRAGPPLRRVPRAEFWPGSAWPLGAPVYWAITATNLSTGESSDGPVSRFDVLPAGTPIDSVAIPPTDWGYFNSFFPNSHPCYVSSLQFGENSSGALRYELPAGVELAAARLDATLGPGGWSDPPGSVELWVAAGPWLPCLVGSPGPPFPDDEIGALARAQALPSPRLRYESPAFTAWLQKTITDGVPANLMPVSQRALTWVSVDGPTNLEPRIRIQYYRLSASGPSLRHGRPRP